METRDVRRVRQPPATWRKYRLQILSRGSQKRCGRARTVERQIQISLFVATAKVPRERAGG
jgi:hypothetical protein